MNVLLHVVDTAVAVGADVALLFAQFGNEAFTSKGALVLLPETPKTIAVALSYAAANVIDSTSEACTEAASAHHISTVTKAVPAAPL
jgi:hypothetical protein